MVTKVIRSLRTTSSERFILVGSRGEDSAVVDLHYLQNGNVSGTLIIFENGSFTEAQVPDLLKYIDEVLLPEVSIDHHNVAFAVVLGRVVGDFLPYKLNDLK